MPAFTLSYLEETIAILREIDVSDVEAMVAGLAEVREANGRLFILGVGGSAAHASHAVNDFRKICRFEAYAPTDNVSELTARTNDEGWETCFAEWLRCSRISSQDAVLVFSVGGGDAERNVSPNIVRALEVAIAAGAKVFGIIGRDGGYTARVADACVIVPPLFGSRTTPHTEGICAVIWHLVVSHPALKANETRWEAAATVMARSL